MRIAYFECFAGISGDMVLGAFVDSGLKLSALTREIAKLKIGPVKLKARKVKRGHITATKVDICLKKKIRFSNFKELITAIDKSTLDSQIKRSARDILTGLVKAEARVHRQSRAALHFHQLGDPDTLIDIVGCVAALRLLDIDKVYSSGVTFNSAAVFPAKEAFPLPAPAAMELLKGHTITIHPGITHEMVTPTGAAIIAALSQEIVQPFPMRILKIGYGAGTYNKGILPNVLRISIAELPREFCQDQVTVIEANIDDMLALNFEILFERLFAAGALDVYTQPVMMKKSRPATVLHVQADEVNVEKVVRVLFEETTTLGVRLHTVARRKLKRKVLNLKTNYGIIVRVKIAMLGARIVNIAPEYDDCKKIAQRKSLPFKTVYSHIKAQALQRFYYRKQS